MTRLFLRYYLGVLLILVFAWLVQAYVFRERSAAANARIVEEALSGGVRLAREKLAATAPNDRTVALQELQRRFDFPVAVVSGDDIPAYARQRFAKGDDVVLIGRTEGGFIVAPLSKGEEALQFGVLPTFVGPSQTELMTGLGVILLLAAGAIALLLRPVARQLRLLERTATTIAGGDFSARVDERKVKAAKPLAQAFNNMAARTETMLRTQRELLQAVSHELRTPLARIHFAIDLIRDAPTNEQREKRLNSLDSATQDLDELVGELLRYVRQESSDLPLELEDVLLRPLVEDLIEKHSPLFPAVTFEVDQELRRSETNLRADRTNLARVLGNSLGNAGRFAKSRVVIRVSESSDGLIIDVDDDGPGIPAANRERVFDPFVRLDDSGRGAGLGLALVRRIVIQHGGQVAALESPLGGCRIRTIWPRTVS